MGKILGLLGAAIAPPVAAFAFLQTWAKAHPVLALLLFLAYEAVVVGIGFVAKLVGGTADELSTRWKAPLAKSIDERTRRRLSGFGRRYRDHVLGSLRFIDLKGLATMGFYTPQLDEVFVDVSLVHSDPSKVPSGVLGHRHTDPTRRSIGDLIDQPAPVVLALVGAPGCGKTTLLRHTALQVRRKRRRRRDVPVLLYLRDHIQAITAGTALPGLIHPDAPPGWFEQKLRAGSCVVLLDGLDEVADQANRREVSDWVEHQVARYPLNDFVITSRPHGYQSAPISGADVVQVRGFTDDQVTRFVRGWYLAFEQRSTGEKSADVTRRAAEEADDLLERLHQNHTLYELTVNPLLLTMISNVHKFRGALPGSRVDLYGEICQVLLWRRQEAKKLASELTGDQKMTLLSGLAFTMMSRHIRDLSRDQLAIEFRSSLRRMTGGVNEDDFITDMMSGGLLLEREPDLFAFAHLTFQEYLAAHHIREKQLTQVLVDNVDDVWWRETTLLYVARANADPIVRACLDSRTVRALSLALDCAEQASELDLKLRTDIEAMLDSVFDENADSPLRQHMIRVVVSRHLRKFVRTDEGTRLCSEPVTNRIYQLFLESHPLCRPDAPPGQPDDEPVRGVRREDALAFIEWINEDLVLDQTFRLPRYAELASSTVAKKLGSLAPWKVADEGAPALWFGRIHTIHAASVCDELSYDLKLLPDSRRRALQLLVPASSDEITYVQLLRRIFADSIRTTAVGIDLPFRFDDLMDSVQEAQLTPFGASILSDFVEMSRAVLSRAVPLIPPLTAELRLTALCLSTQTDDPNLSAKFHEIALAVTLLEHRADGRSLATETIVLATD